jgi:hypothetical protein
MKLITSHLISTFLSLFAVKLVAMVKGAEITLDRQLSIDNWVLRV